MCMGSGGCALRTDISCNVTDNGCIDATHASVCNSDGKGFQSVTCPMGTTCSGFGNCIGTCVVGSSICNGAQIVRTCTDGFTYTDANCMPGMTQCVTTSSTNAVLQTAACKPAECSTTSGTVCGNRASDATSTDPNYASTCVQSPAGMHWQSEQCPITSSCVPGSGCVQTCVPGQQRCNGNAIQTCGSNAQWGAITSCAATPTGAEQTCQYPAGYATPVCGDPVCTGYAGACEADGFHPCVDGKVSTAGAECAIGVCVSTTEVGGYQAGSCQSQCNPGDSRCDGVRAYEGCDANHRWSSTVTQCPASGTDACVQYTDPASGSTKTLCGVCAPGTHRCTDSGGVVGGANPNTFIEACDSTGHWASPGQCSQGQCQSISPDPACVMQCTPNATLCLGSAPASPSNPIHPGLDHWGTCDANGNVPTTGGTACGAGTSCRKHSSGQAVGVGALACVQCVGSDNEVGLTDTLCVTSASPNSIETCTSGNTWSSATPCSATAPYTGICKPEGNVPSCGPYLDCTNSAAEYYYGLTCQTDWGVPAGPYGSAPDCCLISYCESSAGPVGPAACQ